MHLSIAGHYCGNELAAVKWSFSGEKAGCGMEDQTSSCPEENALASNCCHNHISAFDIDQNYTHSNFSVKDINPLPLHAFMLPSNSLRMENTNLISYTDTRPPGCILSQAVDLAAICIFRI